MTGYVVHSGYYHGYAQFAPIDGSLAWSGSLSHAAVMTLQDAGELMASLDAVQLNLVILPDYQRREPTDIPLALTDTTARGAA